jgi:hypothetical protein
MVLRLSVETLADAIALLRLVWLLPIIILLIGLPIVVMVRLLAAFRAPLGMTGTLEAVDDSPPRAESSSPAHVREYFGHWRHTYAPTARAAGARS